MSTKSPYVSNNGLFVTGRTSQSISLAWPVEEIIVSVDESESETEKPVIPTTTTSRYKPVIPEPEPVKKMKVIRVQNGNWYELEMKKGEHSSSWTSIYKLACSYCI